MPVPGLIPEPSRNELTIAYAANADNVNLFTDLGSPAYPVDVTVMILDGVTIGAAVAAGQDAPNPAFRIPSSFAAGSRVYLINRGRIAGGGGIGGEGDRGRRDTGQGTAFVGGGGGGGAGSSSQGGLESPFDFDPDNTATDGSSGTTTLGGAAGAQDPNEAPGVGDGGYSRGASPQRGGSAISCNNVDLWIDNTSGEIWAGGDGGEGGYQDGPLSGGNTVAPTAGSDLATAVTSVTVQGDEPAAVYFANINGASGYTLTWVAGDTYPDVRGYVREIA